MKKYKILVIGLFAVASIVTGAFAYAKTRTITIDTDNKLLLGTLGSEKMAVTPEGGLAIQLTNETGDPSVKGYLIHSSTLIDSVFHLIEVNEPNIFGIVYEVGVADGFECWVVI